MQKQPTTGEWIIIGAGAIMLIFSFFDFAKKTSAWGQGAFPIVTLIVIYGVVMAGQIALAKFWKEQHEPAAPVPTREPARNGKAADERFVTTR